MRRHSAFTVALAGFLTVLLVLPPEMLGQGVPATQRAGQVTQVVPPVSIHRGQQQVTAVAQSPVFWQDVVTTERRARARLTLEDGSVLNVGSESSLTVTRHDATASQTDLELSYGRLRSQVTRSAKPGSGFKVRTPTAVAGVVGTDFLLIVENDVTTLIVYEGLVQFCNLAGACVAVGQGMTSSVRSNENPAQPTQVSPSMAMQAAQSTQIAAPVAAGVAAHGLLLTIVAIASVVVPVVIAVNVSPNADKILVRCPTGGATQPGKVQLQAQPQVCGVLP